MKIGPSYNDKENENAHNLFQTNSTSNFAKEQQPNKKRKGRNQTRPISEAKTNKSMKQMPDGQMQETFVKTQRSKSRQAALSKSPSLPSTITSELNRPNRLNRQQIKEISREKATLRYQEIAGPKSSSFKRMVDQFLDITYQLFKNDELKVNIDTILPININTTSHVLSDIDLFTMIEVCSKNCTMLNYLKNKGQLEKAEQNPAGHTKEDFNKLSMFRFLESKMNSFEAKLLSQDFRINFTLFDGLAHQFTTNKVLRQVTLLNVVLSPRTWGNLGKGIGQNKSMKHLAINVCNLNAPKCMENFMKGFKNNKSVEYLDLSENGLQDMAGITVLSMIKQQSEERDNIIWSDGLRVIDTSIDHGPPEDDLNIYNIQLDKTGANNIAKIVRKRKKRNPQGKVKGLREICLKQNRLGNSFCKSLQSCLLFDKYMKCIDLSHNNISHDYFKSLINLALKDNTSLVSLDIRFNQGASPSILKQVALCMLKNISDHRTKKLYLKDKWIKPEVFKHHHIPHVIFDRLRINLTGQKIKFNASAMPRLDGDQSMMFEN